MTYSDTTDCARKGKSFKKEFEGFREYEESKEVGAFQNCGTFGGETP